MTGLLETSFTTSCPWCFQQLQMLVGPGGGGRGDVIIERQSGFLEWFLHYFRAFSYFEIDRKKVLDTSDGFFMVIISVYGVKNCGPNSIHLLRATLPREQWLWRRGRRGPPRGTDRGSILISPFPQARGDPDWPVGPSDMDVNNEDSVSGEGWTRGSCTGAQWAQFFLWSSRFCSGTG